MPKAATTIARSRERVFATTNWSAVMQAGNSESTEAAGALEHVCERYWYPVYAFVRRSGYDSEQAKDLVQGFFEKLLRKNTLAIADASKGRFRSFLLAAVKHHLSDERKLARAQKRGGGLEIASLDQADPEERYRLEPVDELTPETLFQRRWARAVLNLALDRLQEEMTDAGHEDRFACLKPFLLQQQQMSYREAAARSGMSESAVKSAINRLRIRFRELVYQEIAQTVATPDLVDDEIRYLFRLFSAG